MPLLKEVYGLDGEKIPFNFHEIIALLAPRAFFTNAPVNDSNFATEGVKEGIRRAVLVYDFFGARQNLQVRHPEAEHDFPISVRLEAYQFLDQHLDHVPSPQTLE
jgi:hypothetical protein